MKSQAAGLLQSLTLFVVAPVMAGAVHAQGAPPDDARFVGNAFTAFEMKPYENFRVIDGSRVNTYCTPNLPECQYLSGDRFNRPDTVVRVKNYARRTSETATALAARLPNDWPHLLLAPGDDTTEGALVRVTLRNWQGLPAVDALWMSPKLTAPAISRFVFYPSGFRQQFECAQSLRDEQWRTEDFEQQCERGFRAITFRQEFVPAGTPAAEEKIVLDACRAPEMLRVRETYTALAAKMIDASQAHVKALSIIYELKPGASEAARSEIFARLVDASEETVEEMRRTAQTARNLQPAPLLIGLHGAIVKAAQAMNHSARAYANVTEGDWISDSMAAAQTALAALAPVKQDPGRCPFP